MDLVIRNVAGPGSEAATAASKTAAAATDVVMKDGAVSSTGSTAATTATIFGVSKGLVLAVGATFAALASAGIIAGLAVGLRGHSDHSSTVTTSSGITRTVYLAAEEVLWNYGPYNFNNCTGLPYGDVESIFMIGEHQLEGSGTIGSVYHKRIWKQYTNISFTEEIPVPLSWAHKGFFGPVIRVAVGETLKVYVKNKSRYPVSFHPIDFHLESVKLFNSTDDADDSNTIILSNHAHQHRRALFDPLIAGVQCDDGNDCPTATYDPLFSSYVLDTLPDELMVYTYHVPTTAGPSAESGTDTVARLYQSLAYDSHELSLSGILIVSNPGYEGKPSDSNIHELVSLFSVSNENESPYLDLNIVDFILRPRYMHHALHENNTVAYDEHAMHIGSPVFYYGTLDPETIVMALYKAAAESLHIPKATITAKLNDLSFFQNLISSSSNGVISSIDNVPLGIKLNTTTHIVDTTQYVSSYGQVTVEDVLPPILSSLYYDDANFDADVFDESNMMHSLNGIMYCNHEPMEFPEGSIGRWYGGVIGTEVDMHTLHWHGNVLLHNGHRTDAIQLLPRTVVTADMHGDNPGKWLYHCHVTDHLLAGMLSTYTVVPHTPLPDANNIFTPSTGGKVVPPKHIASELTGFVRHYYIAAEPEVWNFTSEQGYADCAETPGSLTAAMTIEEVFSLPVSTKVRYIEYTDETFTTRKERTIDWAHLEIVGPIIRGEVGDTLKITFLNRSPRPFSVHPHGILYRKDSEGAPYHDGSTDPVDMGDNNVLPGENWTHTWFVPESAGPGPADGDSIVWLYHGHVHEAEDENIGLVGAIIITARGKATSTTQLRPKNVDREFLLLFKVFEPVEVDGLENFTMDSNNHHHMHHRQLESEEDHPHMFTINGKVFCGVPNLSMYVGERVRWYLVSLGNEIDVHHSSFAGASLLWKQHRVNGVPLLAGTMHQADMVPEMPGTFLIFDGSRESHGLGTEARYTVLPPNNPVTKTYPSPSYTYYIGAQEIEWDYIGPSDTDSCVPEFAKPFSSAFAPEETDDQFDTYGTNLNRFPEGGRIFVRRDEDNFIGRVYKKAVYRSYTDNTFTKEINRTSYLPPLANFSNSLRGSIYNLTQGNSPVNDDHLGLLGPIIRGAVGQSIRIVFKNILPESSPLTAVNLVPMHALQIIGFRIWNSTRSTWITIDASQAKLYPVDKNEIVEYTLYIPESAGPGVRDPSSIVWAYSSAIDPTNHLYAGLYGAIIIAKDADLIHHPDVDREFVISMMISDESLSPYLDHNIETYAVNASAIDTENEDFLESNKKHGFNGRLFCNLPGLTARVGEKIRWHMLAMGGPIDFHTPTFQGGSSVVYDGGYRPTLDVYPGMGISVDGIAESTGLHMLECGVNDHWLAGMRALFYVQE